jgi:hypothetical protein
MTTHHVKLDRETNYGPESSVVFRAEGPGFHNREFMHKVSYYPRDGVMRLSAVASVIAAQPVDRAPVAGTVRIGDTIEIEGMGAYVVTRKALADPVLIPVEES